MYEMDSDIDTSAPQHPPVDINSLPIDMQTTVNHMAQRLAEMQAEVAVTHGRLAGVVGENQQLRVEIESLRAQLEEATRPARGIQPKGRKTR